MRARPPTAISGGQQTRAALARLVIADPDLLRSSFHSQAAFNWSKVSDPELDTGLDQAARAGLRCGTPFTFGRDYAATCRQWASRLVARSDRLTALGYGGPALRHWRYYIEACAAAFAVAGLAKPKPAATNTQAEQKQALEEFNSARVC